MTSRVTQGIRLVLEPGEREPAGVVGVDVRTTHTWVENDGTAELPDLMARAFDTLTHTR